MCGRSCWAVTAASPGVRWAGADSDPRLEPRLLPRKADISHQTKHFLLSPLEYVVFKEFFHFALLTKFVHEPELWHSG